MDWPQHIRIGVPRGSVTNAAEASAGNVDVGAKRIGDSCGALAEVNVTDNSKCDTARTIET